MSHRSSTTPSPSPPEPVSPRTPLSAAEAQQRLHQLAPAELDAIACLSSSLFLPACTASSVFPFAFPTLQTSLSQYSPTVTSTQPLEPPPPPEEPAPSLHEPSATQNDPSSTDPNESLISECFPAVSEDFPVKEGENAPDFLSPSSPTEPQFGSPPYVSDETLDEGTPSFHTPEMEIHEETGKRVNLPIRIVERSPEGQGGEGGLVQLQDIVSSVVVVEERKEEVLVTTGEYESFESEHSVKAFVQDVPMEVDTLSGADPEASFEYPETELSNSSILPPLMDLAPVDPETPAGDPAVELPETNFSDPPVLSDMFPLDMSLSMDLAEVETELPPPSHPPPDEVDTLSIPSLSTQSSLLLPSSQPDHDTISLSSSVWTLETEKGKGEPMESAPAEQLGASLWGAYLAERVRRFGGKGAGEDLGFDHRFGEMEMVKKGWLGTGVRVVFGRGEEGSVAPVGSDELGECDVVDVTSDDSALCDPAPPAEEMEPKDEKSCPYDYRKARRLMLQMEQHLLKSRLEPENLQGIGLGKGKGGARLVEMEDPFLKTLQRRSSWTGRQKVFFDACVRILYQERHARMAIASDPEEAILRRLSLDRCAGRFRRLMAGTQWNGRMVYWLHSVVIDNLPPPMLAIYFEILQTLRPKIAELVNSLLNYMLPPCYDVSGGSDKLMRLMEEPWDPVGRSLFRFNPLVKLAKEVVFIMAPHPYAYSKARGGLEEKEADFMRTRTFQRFFSQFGLLVQVEPDASPTTCTATDLYKNWMHCTRTTIIEMSRLHADKALVLIGLGVGSLLACQATLLDGCQSLCTAIICLGFPLKSPRGIHGRYGSPLLKLQPALQFVIGLTAHNCPLEEFVEFRSQLDVESEVVLAAGCDDYLRMKAYMKQRLRMTQSMADRCLLEECIHFLHRILPKAEHRRAMALARAALPVVEVSPKKRKTKAPATTASKPASKRSKTVTNPGSPSKSLIKTETHSLTSESPTSSSASQSQDSSSFPSTAWPPGPPTPDNQPPLALPSISTLTTMPPEALRALTFPPPPMLAGGAVQSTWNLSATEIAQIGLRMPGGWAGAERMSVIAHTSARSSPGAHSGGMVWSQPVSGTGVTRMMRTPPGS